MPDLLTWLQGLPSLLIYLLAAMIVAGETAVIFGLLVPGEATLLLVGFLAYAGTLRIVPALLAMTGAAVIGDTLAFRAGRRYGPRLRASGLGARIGPDRWRRACRTGGSHRGTWPVWCWPAAGSVVIPTRRGRWPPGRPPCPRCAGCGPGTGRWPS